ncbi:hypothetical protein BC829DRAFT_176295 [Chytridium lagenaria]|nr:hypothetical protein BC829DRAFT_176295 [Chytridium lagenaria]
MMLEATTTSDNSSSYGRKFIDGWGLLIIAIPILILDVLLTKYILDEAEILPPFLRILQLAFSALTLTVFKWIRQSPESSPASMRKIMEMEAGDGSASPTSYSAVAVGLCLGFSMAASHGALLHLPVSFLQCLTVSSTTCKHIPHNVLCRRFSHLLSQPRCSSLSKKEAFASSSTSHRKSLFFLG